MTALKLHQQRLLANAVRRSIRKALLRTKESGNFSKLSLRDFHNAANYASTLVHSLKGD